MPTLCFIALTQTAMCDVVEVLNGDRVTGTLNNLTSGRLTFDTPYAGQIYIDWKQVRGIETTFEIRGRPHERADNHRCR
jgi:hypothetical protein